jgi:hypothetical protein
LVDKVEPELVESLTSAIRTKIENLAQAHTSFTTSSFSAPDPANVNPWLHWAEQMRAGDNLAAAERDVRSATTNWDATEIREDGQLAKKFTDILSGLTGDACISARTAVPQLYASFFPDDIKPPPTAKPIASLLFILVAIDDSLSRGDLDLLAQLTTLQIEMGLSSAEYVSLIGDLWDVQKRIGSVAYLPWSLDVCETLAILPCPSDAARDARLRFFLQVLGQAGSFAHRLTAAEFLAFSMLAKDYEVGEDVVTALKRDANSEDPDAPKHPDLRGKTIGIYTLAESAGTRAKAALEKIFPGCRVVVNSDLVATAQLTNLAKMSDLFVFAWKSSSHQAFYCVKEALGGNAPIWALGKGTASILRAVLDRLMGEGFNPGISTSR